MFNVSRLVGDCQVQNTTASVKQIFSNTNRIPIGLNKTKFNPIAYRIKTDSKIVDKLLDDYSELIDSRYVHWFAKRFYYIPFDTIHRCASEARQDGKNPQRLFAFLIKKVNID